MSSMPCPGAAVTGGGSVAALFAVGAHAMPLRKSESAWFASLGSR